jgi:hypothetical protein
MNKAFEMTPVCESEIDIKCFIENPTSKYYFSFNIRKSY